MPSYKASIEIRARPETVFDYVADLGTHGAWSSDPLTITSSGPDRFRSVAVAKGKKITAEITILDRRRPDRLSFEVVDLTGKWTHSFTFASSTRGTTVRRTISGELSGAQSALFWVVLLPVKLPGARRALARLKQQLEKPPE